MPLRNRGYFFDLAFADRFNSENIPTEQTMQDFADSVPFILLPSDRAQLERAGISKTTTDDKVNNRDSTDQAGISPVGFTTFVQPQQVFKLIQGDNILIEDIKRDTGASGAADTGGAIIDKKISLDLPVIPPDDADAVLTTADLDFSHMQFGTTICDSVTVASNNPTGTSVQALLAALKTATDEHRKVLEDVKAQLCATGGASIGIGDMVLTTFPPAAWGPGWLEPNGQAVSRTIYATLFSIFGTTYGIGDGSTTFNLPNYVNNFIRIEAGAGIPPVSLGGATTVTLVEDNLPLHDHTLSTTTDSDGAHNHELNQVTANTGADNGPIRAADSGGPFDKSAFTKTGGTHSHALSGTTDSFGKNPQDPFTILPPYKGMYAKLKAL